MTECPPEFYECLTEEEYDEILDLFDEAGIAPPESMGDAQAAAQFVWDMLFLTPTELLTIGVLPKAHRARGERLGTNQLAFFTCHGDSLFIPDRRGHP